MPQERYNTEWATSNGLGLVGHSTRDVRPLVLALLSEFDAYRANLRLVQSRAVFEVPGILAGGDGRAPAPAQV